jgi:hypothetical protein
MALRAFFTGAKHHSWGAEYLPALSALYDSLIDDDDEVRGTAAVAASHIIGTDSIAFTAADSLVPWLREHFGESKECRARVVCRMVGQPYSGDIQLVPAEEQLRKAMDFDDSLFAAEEQNLFIDEVRETVRWRGAFESLQTDSGGDRSFSSLKAWVEDGLNSLIGRAEREDGVLVGWTSDQHMFAICARILLCAVAVARTGEARIAELLKRFRQVGERTRIHGSLLEMAKWDTVA